MPELPKKAVEKPRQEDKEKQLDKIDDEIDRVLNEFVSIHNLP